MKSCSRVLGVFSMCFVAWVNAGLASAEDWCRSLGFRYATVEYVSRCLRAGADVNARYGKDRRTPLHAAAWSSTEPAVFVALLKAGADVDARDDQRRTPLHIVSYRGSQELITTLLKAGADVNARMIFDHTPLSQAAAYGHSAAITTLLKAGADLSARDRRGYTPLHLAAHSTRNPAATITTLLKAGADVNAETEQKMTPLHLAALSQSKYDWNLAVITLLLASGADPNARNISGQTPMQYALEPHHGRPMRDLEQFRAAFSREAVAAFKEKERKTKAAEIQERLRKAQVSCDKWNTSGFFRNAGASDVFGCLKTKRLSARNQAGETPFHMAAKFGKDPEVVAAIAKAGADVNALDDKGRTPLHTAAVFSEEPEIVTALIEAGADLTMRDKRGRTALEFAEKFGNTPAVIAVLRKYAVPKDTKIAARRLDVERRPALRQLSCEKWNTPSFFKDANLPDLLRCLKTKDVNARSGNGRTPLHYAAQGEKPALVTALAGAGADVNARDERGGLTPLHLAAWFSNTPSVVVALLIVGADPRAKDKVGNTPWEYAAQNAALKDTAPYRRLNEERSR